MKLVFDSGATKCDCIECDKNGLYVRHFSDSGINASYTSDAEMAEILSRLRSHFPNDVFFERILFMGAGCGNADNARRVKTALKAAFRCENAEVASDLLGACRLLCSNEPGLVAILGTGSSACFYNGRDIVQQAPSLGYLLGDEGSGTHIGKIFIRHILRNEVPGQLASDFMLRYGLSRSLILQKLYREPFPNRFLSSFCPYLAENRMHPFIANLLQTAFRDFFEMQIACLRFSSNEKLSLMGSVAYFFKDEIIAASEKFGIAQVRVARSPLDLLNRNFFLFL